MSVKSEVDITFTVPDVPSVEFVVEAPTSRPLSSYDYNPIRSDYNPLTVSVPAGVNGQYVPAKQSSVRVGVGDGVRVDDAVIVTEGETEGMGVLVIVRVALVLGETVTVVVFVIDCELV